MEQNNAIVFQQPRLPYHDAMKDKFGIDQGEWKVLIEAVFPNAQTVDAVCLVLSYCKANKLDVFKKCVHIVPIWDKKKQKNVETIWPGIGLFRTMASRTGVYAGRDATVFGELITKSFPHYIWKDRKKVEVPDVTVTFPEFAQVTVYKIVKDVRCAFVGPNVYWEETFASYGSGAPNAMWQKRPKGQLDKCAEAAALRPAFPDDLGDEYTSDEGPMIHQHGIQEQTVKTFPEAQAEAETEIDEKAGTEQVATFEEEKTETVMKPAYAEQKPEHMQPVTKPESKTTKPSFMED